MSRPGCRTPSSARTCAQIIATLPERERDLLKWLFFDEIDKDEICRRLNIDRDYLRVLLHRAKARFRTEYVGG